MPACSPTQAPAQGLLTSHLQAALTLRLALQVGGPADVDAAVVGAGLSDLQGQHALLAEHAEAGVFSQVQAVLEPGDLGL